MNSINIKIGNDIRILNTIGFYIFLIGILLFIIIGGVLLIGKYLPFEIAIIYFFEVVSQNVYVSFITSLLITIIGFKLADWKNYVETELKIENEKLIWINKGKLTELPTHKIHKLYWRKKLFSDYIKLTIKTIGIKKYETKIDIMNYGRLKNHLSDSKFEHKRLRI